MCLRAVSARVRETSRDHLEGKPANSVSPSPFQKCPFSTSSFFFPQQPVHRAFYFCCNGDYDGEEEEGSRPRTQNYQAILPFTLHHCSIRCIVGPVHRYRLHSHHFRSRALNGETQWSLPQSRPRSRLLCYLELSSLFLLC